MWAGGIDNDTAIPSTWESWRALIERFNLDDEPPLRERMAIVDTLIKQGGEGPKHLARIDPASVLTVYTTNKLHPHATSLEGVGTRSRRRLSWYLCQF